ncbi:glycosyltransferase [SAR86 cluster bacterium]|nr:glycosyltransferase [SAR86 cluster bacterium]
MIISIVIRTLNEEKYLEELLSSLRNQNLDGNELEIVLIDSGSTDNTINIAKKYNSVITYIKKHQFTFGRSLNMGTEKTSGDIVCYISGHCIPCDKNWLINLIEPILKNNISYVYGSQVGRDTTKFSEKQWFKKYFPEKSQIPQNGIFCNNANSALLKSVWKDYKFNEKLTGLEDMDLASRLSKAGLLIAYKAEAKVFHIHNETWSQTKHRYEREAMALQQISPEIQVTLLDAIRYFISGIFLDFSEALNEKCLKENFLSIIKFRLALNSGTYLGNQSHRKLSKKRKEEYFYPKKTNE